MSGPKVSGWSTVGTLTSDTSKRATCNLCTIPLKHSIWKGHKVVYSKSRLHFDGFLCVKCATSKIRRGKKRVTIQELDDFILKMLKKVI